MRDAKDLTKKLTANIAYIFGVRADAYYLDPPTPPLSCVNTNTRTTPTERGYYRGAVAGKSKRRRDNNMEDDNSWSRGAAKRKKKRKQTSED